MMTTDARVPQRVVVIAIDASDNAKDAFDCTYKARFPLPELTARVDGWPVSITRQPCWRVMETGHPSTRAVNSGRQLG